MDSSVQIVDPHFKVLGVLSPRQAVDARRGLFLQVEEACH